MQTALIVFRCLLLLLLQPDDLTLGETVILRTLIVLGQLAIADVHLLAYTLERITTTCYKIIVLVEMVDELNCYDIVNADVLVVEEDAVKMIEEVLK